MCVRTHYSKCVCTHASGILGAVADDDATDRLDAWRGLLLAHAAAVSAIEADLKRAGSIPLSWYDVLLELNAVPGRQLRMSDLGKKVVVSRTRVSRIVDELVAAGLVERRADPHDKRSAFAVLTPAGRTALRQAAPRYLESIERHFTGLLDDRERRSVAIALNRVAAHHRVAQPVPPSPKAASRESIHTST